MSNHPVVAHGVYALHAHVTPQVRVREEPDGHPVDVVSTAPRAHSPSPVQVPSLQVQEEVHVDTRVPQLPHGFVIVAPGAHAQVSGGATSAEVSLATSLVTSGATSSTGASATESTLESAVIDTSSIAPSETGDPASSPPPEHPRRIRIGET
jgi:hypothetical protein